MTCIKTGFHAYLEPIDEWVYGDAFEVEAYGGDTMVSFQFFRICERSHTPIRPVKHFTIHNFSYWFDIDETSVQRNSTMICHPGYVTDHSYEGVPI